MSTRPALHELRTLRQGAAYLGCHPQTLRAKIARGEIKGYRIGRSLAIRVRESDLQALLRPIPTVGT